jgi:hypothetical protein
METQKKPYAKPTILRVSLTHEQAVLSACRTATAGLSQTTGAFCRTSCRRHASGNSTGAS